MKRIHILGALALTTSLAMPVFAQQAPTNAPNPSNPPTEGTGTNRMNQAPSSSGSAMSRSEVKPTQAEKGQRAKKPRQQDAATGPTADSPSGPKGDSPSPAPKN